MIRLGWLTSLILIAPLVAPMAHAHDPETSFRARAKLQSNREQDKADQSLYKQAVPVITPVLSMFSTDQNVAIVPFGSNRDFKGYDRTSFYFYTSDHSACHGTEKRVSSVRSGQFDFPLAINGRLGCQCGLGQIKISCLNNKGVLTHAMKFQDPSEFCTYNIFDDFNQVSASRCH